MAKCLKCGREVYEDNSFCYWCLDEMFDQAQIAARDYCKIKNIKWDELSIPEKEELIHKYMEVFKAIYLTPKQKKMVNLLSEIVNVLYDNQLEDVEEAIEELEDLIRKRDEL